eukprot:11256175-Alexandrium_andersonii.AAC.1
MSARELSAMRYLTSIDWRLESQQSKGVSWLELLVDFELSFGAFVCVGVCAGACLPLVSRPSIKQ